MNDEPAHNTHIKSTRLIGVSLAVLLFLRPFDLLALDPEYSHKPAPGSAHEVESVFDDLHESADEFFTDDNRLIPIMSDEFKEMPFFRDARRRLNFRSYYLHRDKEDSDNPRAWTYGGNLDVASGWWRDFFQMRAVGYLSQKAYGPDSGDGTLLLRNGQQSFAVLGQLHANMKHEGFLGRFYKQTFDLPYLNRQDSRMAPNTFEAYSFWWEDQDKKFKTYLGYVDTIKERNKSSFISMSERAGAEGSDKGVIPTGFTYNFDEKTKLGFIDLVGLDLFNTIYSELEHSFDIDQDQAIKLSVQYTDQRSIGDDLLGDFDTQQIGAKVAYSLRNFVATLGFTSIDDGADLRSPWGGFPLFTSAMIQDFNRADEDALVVGLSYDFKRFESLQGLSTFWRFTFGDTPENGPAASPDQQEYDFTIDYRPGERWPDENLMKDFWLRVRWGIVNKDNDSDFTDFRVILNHSVPLPSLF